MLEPVPEVLIINQEDKTQILRLTTPELHPTNEELFVGTPEN
jgi:hypothetical protein